MLTIFFLKGAPASGKSTWAKAQIAKDPLKYLHINNDDLRASFNGTVFSSDYEKIITSARLFLIKEGLRKDLNLIIDNVNSNNRHWKDIIKLVNDSKKEVQIIEKLFYCDLEELIARDSKREGKACVGEAVIRKFFKDLGGKQFEHSKPRVEIITSTTLRDTEISPMIQDENLKRAAIFDNDGTISLLNGRDPYDASTADNDLPHKHVIECMKLYHNAGYKIIFVSGREEKDRAPTEKFYQKHFPEVKYELYMRPTGNFEKDVVIKDRIYNEYIKDKYYVAAWFDDRLQICEWLHNNGFPLFRVNDPNASF